MKIRALITLIFLCICTSVVGDNEWIDAYDLKMGTAYLTSKQTPLMPEFEPVDPMGAIKRMKQIPSGGAFKIYEIRKKRSTPWYRVKAFDKNRVEIGSGWVNASALLGQTLKILK